MSSPSGSSDFSLRYANVPTTNIKKINVIKAVFNWLDAAKSTAGTGKDQSHSA